MESRGVQNGEHLYLLTLQKHGGRLKSVSDHGVRYLEMKNSLEHHTLEGWVHACHTGPIWLDRGSWQAPTHRKGLRRLPKTAKIRKIRKSGEKRRIPQTRYRTAVGHGSLFPRFLVGVYVVPILHLFEGKLINGRKETSMAWTDPPLTSAHPLVTPFRLHGHALPTQKYSVWEPVRTSQRKATTMVVPTDDDIESAN